MGRKLKIECLKLFNYFKVIKSPRLQTAEYRAEEIIFSLFDAIFNAPERFIEEIDRPYFALINKKDKKKRARFVSDMIAAMTDRQALKFYEKLKTANSGTIFGF